MFSLVAGAVAPSVPVAIEVTPMAQCSGIRTDSAELAVAYIQMITGQLDLETFRQIITRINPEWVQSLVDNVTRCLQAVAGTI